MDCFRQLQREGGPTPGIDGISPVDVSLREFGHIAAKLSQVLIKGSYRPQQTRRVAINKLGTDEKRILKIGVLLDRVVGKALHEALQPIWETIYLPQSYGFRPGHSAWQMLAAVIAMETGHREIPGRQVLLQWMERAYQRWCTCRERVHRQTVRG